jgi:hypothetical protein
LSGQRIERREVGTPGAFDAMTDDELERALIERINASGLTPDAGSLAGLPEPAAHESRNY